MNYVIENEKIKVEISDVGAELQSIYGKTNNFEYLWQANVEGLWKNRATNLFPICGRLFEGKYTYNGKEYEMPLHGFIKLCTFSVLEKSQDRIVFGLTENAETLKTYPFKFSLKIIYSLTGATVKTEFLVENTDSADLPFSVGGHPGFKLPFEENLEFTDHYIEFETAKKRTRIDMSDKILYLGTVSDYPLVNDKIIKLDHSIFNKDAIFLTDNAGSVYIKANGSKKYVKLTFSDTTHVGFWQTFGNNTNFVCIEPWHGIPAYDGKLDDFATKNEFIHLKGGEKYSYTFDITVSE